MKYKISNTSFRTIRDGKEEIEYLILKGNDYIAVRCWDKKNAEIIVKALNGAEITSKKRQSTLLPSDYNCTVCCDSGVRCPSCGR